MKTPARLLAVTLLIAPALHAADYEGADAILKQFASRPAPTSPKDAPENAYEKLVTELDAYRKTSPMLPPDEAAQGWVDLADHYGKVPLTDIEKVYRAKQGRGTFGFAAVIAALPPPPAWKAIAGILDHRSIEGDTQEAYYTVVERALIHRLLNDSAALNKDLAALQSKLEKKTPGQKADLAQFMNQLKGTLLKDSDSGDEIMKQLDSALTAQYNDSVSVPDLVTLVGTQKATDFLRKALAGNKPITIENGAETQKLAHALALEMVSKLKVPQWSLIDSINSTALYEAMAKRFPQQGGSGKPSSEFAKARTYYLLGLIANHRAKDASALVSSLGEESLPTSGIDALEHAGFVSELNDFLHEAISNNPDSNLWRSYVDIAVRAGKQKEMVALAEASAARPNLNETQRIRIQTYLRDAYLATDRVDEGIAILHAQIEEAKKAKPLGPHDRNPPENLNELGMKLAKLGNVLQRKDLLEEGIQVARDGIKSSTVEGTENIYPYISLGSFLLEQDRGTEAEAVLKEGLFSLQPPNPDENRYSSSADEILVTLMAVYDRAGRSADVLALLDNAPMWNGKDLTDILTKDASINRNNEYLGYFVAKALVATDRKADARRVLDALMDKEDDYDPAYELLIQLAPHDEVLARCDALHERDKFESRPLIWKAKVLFDDGKLEEAETAARQAVTIDPSDGEHGPGRRMRVYSVLADIREKRGDAKEAEFFRGVVTAIRHSEDADKFYSADLTTRAIKMYEESLTHFSDAYCIQSRLATRMAELGDMAGAEEHYKRAYELMPDSFGRVESHCFGCEGAFSGYYAQNIAEKVFTDLAKKRPDKPQVHYLLGYLRKEQENYKDALPEFREAVKLDPEYLNAWKEISELDNSMRLTAAERSNVQLNILKLDPLSRHSSFDANKVSDLGALWTALDAAAKLRPAKPGPLYPLKAAVAERAKRDAGKNTNEAETGEDEREERNPSDIIVQNAFVTMLCRIYNFQGVGEGGDE